MSDDTSTRRAQLVRYGIPAVAGALVVLFGIQLFQNGSTSGRGTAFFFVGACIILAGSITITVRDARAAKQASAADEDDETPDTAHPNDDRE